MAWLNFGPLGKIIIIDCIVERDDKGIEMEAPHVGSILVNALLYRHLPDC